MSTLPRNELHHLHRARMARGAEPPRRGEAAGPARDEPPPRLAEGDAPIEPGAPNPIARSLRGCPAPPARAAASEPVRPGVEIPETRGSSGRALAAPPDAEAVVAQFHASVFPKVKAALEAAGGRVNSSYCEMAAGMTKYALDRLGIPGARVVAYAARFGEGHAFVEVPVRGGGVVVLDPTAAQFTRDRSAFDDELQARGFAGTKAELRARIARELETYEGQRYDPLVLEAFRSGAPIPGEDAPTSAALVAELAGHVDEVMRRYDGAAEDQPLARTAELERRWALGDRRDPLMLGVLDGNAVRRVRSNESKRFKTAYDALDRALEAG